MKKSLSKKAKKVIEENLEEFKAMPPLTELTRSVHSSWFTGSSKS
ncbi:MAG: hypothetical protein NTW44_03805 [Nitrospirae bacterium]|nr:hypothetical protein [Nitrospirota bacterium]